MEWGWLFGSSGVVVLSLGLLKGWWERKKAKQDLSIRVIEGVSRIYELLNELQHTVSPGRILVLHAHNGGGMPSPGKTIYSSVLYEVIANYNRPVKQTWQRVPVDGQYVNLLSSVIKEGQVSFCTEGMDAGMLSDIYQSHKTGFSSVWYITHNEHSLYYLSVTWPQSDHKEVLLPEDRTAIRQAVQALSGILSKFP